LEKAYAKLQELDKLKDEFISVTSHELRTPMSTVKGYLWMLAHKGGSLSPAQQRYWQRAWRGTDQMINLINDTLSVSRIEQGRTEFKIAPFDVVALLQETVEGLRVKAAEKGLRLRLLKSPPRLVLADAPHVREVAGNLLENALKYTGEGEVKVAVSADKKEVKVAVQDTGKGIAREDLPKLFHKFGRLEHSFATVAESAGTGLGLYLSKLLVEKMGGRVGVTSTWGKGSTFWFTLPAAAERAS
jgi:signal transduction histidine kinase